MDIVNKHGLDIFYDLDEKGHTPMHWACLCGNTQIIVFLLDNKAPINQPGLDETAACPIHWACVNGHITVIDTLLQVLG